MAEARRAAGVRTLASRAEVVAAEARDIVQEGVDGRRRVHLLVAETRIGEALDVANGIRHPWYRCQALTAVANALHDSEEAGRLLAAAIEAAAAQEEPNRIASVSAWPLSVLVHLDKEAASAHIDRLLALMESESHVVRRADGLLLLMDAIYSDRDLRLRVLVPLRAAILSGRGWKIRRIARDLALVLAEVDPEAAVQLLSSVPETREIRQARRLIAAGERLGPSLRLGWTPRDVN